MKKQWESDNEIGYLYIVYSILYFLPPSNYYYYY